MWHNVSQVCLVPDLELQTFKIHIMMKKEQNLHTTETQALNISVISKRTWEEQRLIDDRLDGKCDLCKSRERYIKNGNEYCGGCGSITKFNVE